MSDTETPLKPAEKPTANTAPFVIRTDNDGADGVTTLSLNRPDELNALSEGMLATLQLELDDIADDRSVRVVVLEGAGRAFCAGHNLKQMRANYSLAYQQELFATCSKMMQSVLRLPQPVIAKVRGLATAAGCQLVATCDLAVAADDAKLATSGINVGLFCSTPGVAVGRAVPRKHAMDLLLTGDFLEAPRAAEIGLINRAVPDDRLDEDVAELAAKLARKSAHALALGKQAFYRQLEMGITDAYAFAGDEMARNMMDRDAAEGIDAFIEKRDPEWDQGPRSDPRSEDD
ncbi:MAG: enoyl-CoA hydratase [Rhodospirillaceae bacterium]|jgi:enoyl-CoA hydratase/carnithine racemase|nr:enoyl-CoA hydratase [Rhodospirillaceae bacterium]MBT5357153.1 enoyl-CoA hydratase [Rhodospirillaceae bacterium]MBT5770391.1 enoyl-CoA hydratase [Rhodospirillaceae bacterium]MBT6310976.1 enoyl-CoA hydratase [Rhodospirillaceae bacterium]MBT7364195.1 enoyl-CoA hydratase [Rhodospirillaceae bacterium]